MTRKNPAAVALGRRGGKVKSAAKAAAVRENGKKGGRPKWRDLPEEERAKRRRAALAAMGLPDLTASVEAARKVTR